MKKFDVYYLTSLLFLLLSSNANFLSGNIYWFLILALMIFIALGKKLLGLKDLKNIGIFSLLYLVFVGVRDLFVNNLEAEFLISDIIFLFKYVFLAFVYIVVLKEKTIPYLVKVMVHLTIVSFFFFFLQIIGLGEELYRYSMALHASGSSDIEGYTNFLIFTFTKGRHDYANSGFVWEPGAYGCFLTLILMLHFFANKFSFDKKSIILIIGILTTFSTTTYLALLMLLFFAYRFRVPKINRWFLLFMPVFVALIVTVPFLGNKIGETYYEDMSDLNRLAILERFYHKQNTQIPLNRFASMTYIYTSFGDELILGVNNRYNDILNKKMDVNISNGIFDFMAKFGLVGLLLLLYFYAKFCFTWLKKKEFLLYSILILLTISFGEPIMHLPLILIFFFLPWQLNVAGPGINIRKITPFYDERNA